MTAEEIRDKYFNWIYDYVTSDANPTSPTFYKLIHCLNDIEFTWTMPEDESRAIDGISVRWRWCFDNDLQAEWDDIEKALDGPCTVLEMIFALAAKMEGIKQDPHKGDRTHRWFWMMCCNAQLYGQYDEIFDEETVRKNVDILLTRKYEKNGRGGLFWLVWTTHDMPRTDIWTQMCWYLDATT